MSRHPTMTRDTPSTLKRSLTLPLLTLYGLGVTVGAGIYVLIGETAEIAGAFAPVAFLVAAIAVGFTAFSYAELSTRMPVAAGVAAYVQAGLRRNWLSLVLGLAVAISGVVSASAVSIGAGGYLAGLTGLPSSVLTIGVVCAMGGVAWWGIKESVTIAGIITLIELAGLALVIFWGLCMVEANGLTVGEMVPSPTDMPWSGIGAASVLAFFAFIGFEDMVNVVEEVKDPRRTLPRAIVATLLVATVLYVAVSVTVLIALPLDSLAGAQAPLLLLFDNAPLMVQAGFASIAVVATVNGVLIQIIMASRVLYGMADRGQLPAVLTRVSPKQQTPWTATAFVTFLILVLSGLVPIAVLAGGTSQIVLTIFVFVNLSLIALKWRGTPARGAFIVPLAMPILGLVTSVGLLMVSML